MLMTMLVLVARACDENIEAVKKMISIMVDVVGDVDILFGSWQAILTDVLLLNFEQKGMLTTFHDDPDSNRL